MISVIFAIITFSILRETGSFVVFPLVKSSWTQSVHRTTTKLANSVSDVDLSKFFQKSLTTDDCKIEAYLKEGAVSCRAKTSIKKGDILCSIPIGICLDAQKARGAFEASSKILSQLRTGDFGLIALLLLYEKSLGKASKYFEYISFLPKVAPGILSWTPTELDELYSSSTRNFYSQIEAVDEDWNLISSKLSDILKFADNDSFKWAIGIVKAKAVLVENLIALVPAIDLMPFDPFSSAEPFVGSAGMFGGKIVKVAAEENYKVGDEIFISYGLKGSAECVEDHGICPELALNDACCELKISLDPTKDKFFDDKADVLEQQGLGTSIRFDIEADPSAKLDNDMLQLLRLKCISGTDAFILESVFSNIVYKTMSMPFSKSNELMVYKVLSDELTALLSRIDSISNADRDAKILANARVEDNQVVMARLRIQEREALQGALKGVEAYTRILNTADTNEYYQERRLRELDLLRPLDEEEIVGF